MSQGDALTIDGDWNGFTSPFEGMKVRLDHGKLYVLQSFHMESGLSNFEFPSGSVIARNFHQVGPREFECDFALIDMFLIGKGRYVPVKAEITTARSLAFHLPDNTQAQNYTEFKGGEKVFLRSGGMIPQSSKSIASIDRNKSSVQAVMNPREFKEEVASEFIEIPAGAVYRIKRSRAIDHSVDLQLDAAVQGEVNLDALSWLRASVKGQVEKRLGYNFKESEMVEHEITLDGNKGKRYKLIWQGRFLSGTAKLREGNIDEAIPFRIKLSEDFSAIPIPSD